MNKPDAFELIEVEGRRKWLVNGVKILPYVAGGDGPEPDPDPKPDPKPDPAARTFTQDEVNTLVGKARQGARDTTTTELMKELGITDPAQAKALIAAAKAAEEANATELDKARKKSEEDSAAAATATAALAASNLTNAIIERLVEHGGLTLSAAKKVRVMIASDKIDDDAIKAAIDDLKKDMPALFAESHGTGQLPGHNPGAQPPGGTGKPNDPQQAAMRTLHERHPQLKKTS